MDGSQFQRPAPMWFERYLRERGYPFTREPGLATAAGPGCVVSVAGRTVACAVMGSGGAFDLTALLDGFEDAAHRLGSARYRGTPCVIVVECSAGGWLHSTADICRRLNRLLHGDIPRELHDTPDVPWSPRGDERPEQRLADAYPHISAVAVMARNSHASQWLRTRIVPPPKGLDSHQGWLHTVITEIGRAPRGGFLSVDTLETLGRSASPLPGEIFDGPTDRRWIPDAFGDCIEASGRD
ncbi:hypothetical protein [Kitasatospora sp. MBT63]|uniref:hypothetical protein n=1 Tax=Kitasatospora sp. MBT63 TaxID=1444768 RepID=UPI00053B4452|nr:hypothetical protein [Kitasatospora sp. MBT63]